ncbi:MAG: hypothetical protein HP492_10650 [Nitrospira sp.]|nr:hypothetical protein [Nitrospira sp.]
MHTFFRAQTIRYAGALVSLSLLATGCSTLYGWSNVHKSARGSVYIKDVADWSFEANHPAVVDQATLLIAVKGVVADDATKSSPKMPASGSKPMRVFSDEDAEFLAPLLAQGLSQAKPEQIVGFTVSPSAGSGAEPAAGTLYVSRGSLHLTINPGNNRRISGFMPSGVARIERAPAYNEDWTPGTLAMIIDPQALAKASLPGTIPVAAAESKSLPAPAILPVPLAKTKPAQHDVPAATPTFAANTPPATAGQSEDLETKNNELLLKKLDELRQVREANRMKESEIAMLKKEVEWMKQELRERSAEAKTNTVSKRSVPKRKPAEAYPTR